MITTLQDPVTLLAIVATAAVLAIACAIGWWRSAVARARIGSELLQSDAHLRAVAEALDLPDPERRQAQARRAKAGKTSKNWRNVVAERAQGLRRERDEAVAAVRASPGGTLPALTPAGILNQSAAILAALADAVAANTLGARANEIARTLGLAQELAAARQTLDSLAEAGTAEAVLESLEAGTLGHVLTTAELLAAYFPAEPDFALLAESYASVAALLRLLLAMAGVTVLVPRYLGSADLDPDIVVERFDRRELRRIPEIAATANRVGDRMGYDAVVVVDCIVPGWRGPDGKHPPTIVSWQRAAWRAP